MPETCWAVFKRQVINLRGCCILLVDSVESKCQVGKLQGPVTIVWTHNYGVLVRYLDFILKLGSINTNNELWVVEIYQCGLNFKPFTQVPTY